MGSYRKISVDVGPLLLSSISKMAVAKTRASPFRESEWERRLDGLLQDLENSTQISESRQVSYSRVQHHNHQITKARSSCSLGTSSTQNTSHGNVTTDNMLKDLDVALRASRNYIESTNDEKMRSNTGEGFNLERQVEHMMPQAGGCSNIASYSTSMQASKQASAQSTSFITSKVQTNTYNSSQNNEVSRIEYPPRQASPERPVSKTPSLKANIDELDNILTDLNNSIASGLNSKGQTMSPSPMPPILKVDKHASPRPISPAVEFKKASSVGPGPFPTT